MPVADEQNVLEGLLSITPDGGKAGIMRAYQPVHGKKPVRTRKISFLAVRVTMR